MLDKLMQWGRFKDSMDVTEHKEIQIVKIHHER